MAFVSYIRSHYYGSDDNFDISAGLRILLFFTLRLSALLPPPTQSNSRACPHLEGQFSYCMHMGRALNRVSPIGLNMEGSWLRADVLPHNKQHGLIAGCRRLFVIRGSRYLTSYMRVDKVECLLVPSILAGKTCVMGNVRETSGAVVRLAAVCIRCQGGLPPLLSAWITQHGYFTGTYGILVCRECLLTNGH